MRFEFRGKSDIEEKRNAFIEEERKRIYGAIYWQLKALGFFEKGYEEQREIWDAVAKGQTGRQNGKDTSLLGNQPQR